MRRIAIINQKGGVGKTTTAANLGAALALAGKRVLVVDMDPQANLSLYLGTEVGPDEPSVYPVLCSGMPADAAIRPTRTPGLFLLPAHIDLSGAELELASTFGRETILRDALDELERTWAGRGEPLDVVLLDCPPSLGLLSINALTAAREVMLVVQTEFFALQGLSKLVEVVHLIRRRLNPELEITGLLPCLYDSRLKLAREVLAELRRFFPEQVFAHPIRTNVKLAESPSHSLTIFEYAPESNGARDYEALATELLARGGEPPEPPPEREEDRRGEALLATARALRVAESAANQRRLEEGEQLRVAPANGAAPTEAAQDRAHEPAVVDDAPHQVAVLEPQARSGDPVGADAQPQPEDAIDPEPAGRTTVTEAPPRPEPGVARTPAADPTPADHPTADTAHGASAEPAATSSEPDSSGSGGAGGAEEARGANPTPATDTQDPSPSLPGPAFGVGVLDSPGASPAAAESPVADRAAIEALGGPEAHEDPRPAPEPAQAVASPALPEPEADAPRDLEEGSEVAAEPTIELVPHVPEERAADPQPGEPGAADALDDVVLVPAAAASSGESHAASTDGVPEEAEETGEAPLRPAPFPVYTWGQYIGEDRHVPRPRA